MVGAHRAGACRDRLCGTLAASDDGTAAQSFSDFSDALRAAWPAAHLGSLVVLAQVDSTNLLGRRVVGEYLKEEMRPPRAVLVAYEQTAGRGRHGRAWRSPPGAGVYASLLVPEPQPEALARLPLAVAVGLADALAAAAGVAVRLKWPNDLLLGGRKLGGILVDSVARGNEVAAAIVGFGVNLGADAALPDTATALARHAPSLPALADLARALVEGVDVALGAAPELPRLVQRYAELSAHRPGDRLVCQLGEERLEGTFLGFDERGHLRVAEASGGERRVASGDVFLP